MPYVKPLEPKFVKMQRLILGRGLNSTSLGQILECSRPTAQKRIKKPEDLTLRDLAKLSRRGHIPWEEILEAVRI